MTVLSIFFTILVLIRKLLWSKHHFYPQKSSLPWKQKQFNSFFSINIWNGFNQGSNHSNDNTNRFALISTVLLREKQIQGIWRWSCVIPRKHDSNWTENSQFNLFFGVETLERQNLHFQLILPLWITHWWFLVRVKFTFDKKKFRNYIKLSLEPVWGGKLVVRCNNTKCGKR